MRRKDTSRPFSVSDRYLRSGQESTSSLALQPARRLSWSCKFRTAVVTPPGAPGYHDITKSALRIAFRPRNAASICDGHLASKGIRRSQVMVNGVAKFELFMSGQRAGKSRFRTLTGFLVAMSRSSHSVTAIPKSLSSEVARRWVPGAHRPCTDRYESLVTLPGGSVPRLRPISHEPAALHQRVSVSPVRTGYADCGTRAVKPILLRRQGTRTRSAGRKIPSDLWSRLRRFSQRPAA